MDAEVRKLEKLAGAKFGSTTNPLLVSVRSGAQVLDAGHDGHDPQPRAERSGRRRVARHARSNGRFAYDSYRRFIQMYGDVVLEIPKDKFEHELRGGVKHAHGAKTRHRSCASRV